MVESNFHYAITNPEIVGFIGWTGTIIGIISLFVTIAGFLIALDQIRRVKKSSEAAQEAVIKMTKIVRAREQGAKLSNSLSAIRSATTYIIREKPEAAAAYLDYCCTSLVDARHLSDDESDKSSLTDEILKLRRLASSLENNNLSALSQNKLKSLNSDLRSSTSEIEVIVSKVHYNFDQTGVTE